MDYLVSVGVITFNHEKYIAQALESVMMQKTRFKFEVIVGEDCSTDNTRAIVRKYECRYPEIIKPIYQAKNVGALRNLFEFTFPQCKGKFLAYLEGDDYWTDPYKLQRQVDFLEANPDYGLIYSKARVFIQNKGKFGGYLGIKKESFCELLLGDTIPTLTICIRRDLMTQYYKEIKDELGNWKKSDFPIWLNFAYYSKIRFEDNVTAVYRVLDSSASHFRDFTGKAAFHLDTYNIAIHYFRKFNCNDLNLYESIIEKYMWGVFSFWCELNTPQLKGQIENEIKNIRHRRSLRITLMRLALKYPVLRFFFIYYYRMRN